VTNPFYYPVRTYTPVLRSSSMPMPTNSASPLSGKPTNARFALGQAPSPLISLKPVVPATVQASLTSSSSSRPTNTVDSLLEAVGTLKQLTPQAVMQWAGVSLITLAMLGLWQGYKALQHYQKDPSSADFATVALAESAASKTGASNQPNWAFLSQALSETLQRRDATGYAQAATLASPKAIVRQDPLRPLISKPLTTAAKAKAAIATPESPFQFGSNSSGVGVHVSPFPNGYQWPTGTNAIAIEPALPDATAKPTVRFTGWIQSAQKRKHPVVLLEFSTGSQQLSVIREANKSFTYLEHQWLIEPLDSQHIRLYLDGQAQTLALEAAGQTATALSASPLTGVGMAKAPVKPTKPVGFTDDQINALVQEMVK
jgi:hypothetical protein